MSLGHCGHAFRSLRPPLIQFPFQVPPDSPITLLLNHYNSFLFLIIVKVSNLFCEERHDQVFDKFIK
ncbi:unnamed protein product [Schistosoma margrebowiei]|uniref:Uncharacterized protein n=1 Tax=Schistosoma margrebowiei TaxID=48269 RepID=A0A3P8DM31_9TREM|nr:unnamed protein product [Schistosoma margrebowiei]